jgi:hypothetical protein
MRDTPKGKLTIHITLPPIFLTCPYLFSLRRGPGLTGIASAAHAVAHGFEVVIYESEEDIGGVWAR